MTNINSIFNRLELEAERHPMVVASTSKNKIEGRLVKVDSQGNLVVLTDEGTTFIQRQYLISLTILKNKSISP